MAYKSGKFEYKGQQLTFHYNDYSSEQTECIENSSFDEVKELIEKLKSQYNLKDEDFAFGTRADYGDSVAVIEYFKKYSAEELENAINISKQNVIEDFERNLKRARDLLKKVGEIT